MDSEGNLFDYVDFINEYKMTCTRQQYLEITRAIPDAMLNIIKGMISYDKVLPILPLTLINDLNFTEQKCTNKVIRGAVTNTLFPLPLKRRNILHQFSKDQIKKIRTRYLYLPVSPKAKETHLKIINDIYPCNDFLRQRFNLEKNDCTFCESQIESLEHLFFECEYVKTFWRAFQNWISESDSNSPNLSYEIIKFGVLLEDRKRENVYNTLLILAQQHIHRCRFMKIRPLFCIYMNELKNFKKALKYIKTKQAMNVINLINALIQD